MFIGQNAFIPKFRAIFPGLTKDASSVEDQKNE
jgi:hypothetical protein